MVDRQLLTLIWGLMLVGGGFTSLYGAIWAPVIKGRLNSTSTTNVFLLKECKATYGLVDDCSKVRTHSFHVAFRLSVQYFVAVFAVFFYGNTIPTYMIKTQSAHEVIYKKVCVHCTVCAYSTIPYCNEHCTVNPRTS